MFNPSQLDVRLFFYQAYEKAIAKIHLNDMEKIAYSAILLHPEYNYILDNKKKYLEYKWSVENGQINPFLHLSMHITINEQLTVNQPIGINDYYKKLCSKFGSNHNAEHELMDCIAEMIHHAQQNNTALDKEIYFSCIQSKLQE